MSTIINMELKSVMGSSYTDRQRESQIENEIEREKERKKES